MSPDIAECMLHFLMEMDTRRTPDKNSFDVQDALLFTLLLTGWPRTFCPHSTLTDIQSTGNVSSAFARQTLRLMTNTFWHDRIGNIHLFGTNLLIQWLGLTCTVKSMDIPVWQIVYTVFVRDRFCTVGSRIIHLLLWIHVVNLLIFFTHFPALEWNIQITQF